jgi:hypothetical protein
MGLGHGVPAKDPAVRGFPQIYASAEENVKNARKAAGCKGFSEVRRLFVKRVSAGSHCRTEGMCQV